MSDSRSPKPSRILAVDDSPDNLFLLETILDGPDFELVCVDRGQEALKQAVENPPDLILLDVMMPGLDGYEVTRRIRQNPSLPYIPILLITAHDQSSLVEGLDAGADDFVRKPFNIDELLARVRAMLRLKRSMDAQTLMLRQRDDFVARLTHDLRTPLVAANRMLQFCRDEAFGTVADDAKQAIASTIRNNEHLLSMVNTLLEVYRHEAGHKKLTYTLCDLKAITASVVSELQALADEKELNLTFDVRHQDPDQEAVAFTLEGDQLELRRLVTNLVGNAIKFTDEGYIKVRLQRCQDIPDAIAKQLSQPEEAEGWLVLEVEDSGVGISEEDQAEIFQWFRQGKHRRSGNGLGLHLTQRIADLHGGMVQVSSQLHQGSVFTVYLPAARLARA